MEKMTRNVMSVSRIPGNKERKEIIDENERWGKGDSKIESK